MQINQKLSCKELFKDKCFKFYNLMIDDNKYSFLIAELLEILFLSDDEYKNILSKDILINGIKKENYFYAIKNLFKEYNLLDNYIFPDKIISRINDINNNISIDIQSINDYLQQEGLELESIVINQELKNTILKDISLFSTDLEKAIYIYIKMCKILTYDEEYFAVGQNEEYDVVRKHQDIFNIKNITLSNNKIVCHDFNAIYAKLLNELGILSKTTYTELVGYGNSHPSLTFRCSNFLIKVDSVTSVLNGDITNAKLNQRLKGIICINENQKTKKEFLNILTKVYYKISEKETIRISKNKVMEIENYEDIKKEYCSDSNIELDIYEKLAILIKKVNSTNLIGIDFWSYLLQLRKILFTQEECDNNVKIVIIRNNEFNPIKASAIIVINEDNLANDFYDNEYYLCNIGHEPVYIDVVTLQNKFSNGMYQYVIKSGSRIPNLILENNLFLDKKLFLEKNKII